MHIPTNLNELAVEICKREKSDDREVNITKVKRVLSHLSDIIFDEWRLYFNFKITNALRQSGKTRYNRAMRARK